MTQQPMNLGALLAFLSSNKAPAVQAPNIKDLILPYPGQEAEALNAIRRRNAERMGEKADEVIGVPGHISNRPILTNPFEPNATPESGFEPSASDMGIGSQGLDAIANIGNEFMPEGNNLESPQTYFENQDVGIQGTGYFDPTKSRQQRSNELMKRMYASSEPGYQDKAAELLTQGGKAFKTATVGGSDPSRRQTVLISPDGEYSHLGNEYTSQAPKWLDAGLYNYNPVTGEKVSKNIAATNITDEMSKNETEFIVDYNNTRRENQANLNHNARTIDYLDGLFDQTNYSSTGIAGYLTSWVPGTPANEWKVVRNTLNSRMGLEKLKMMKQESRTGASGLGQLSEKELDLLIKYMGNLQDAQDPASAKKQILNIRNELYNANNRIQQDLRASRSKYDKILEKPEWKNYDPTIFGEKPIDLAYPDDPEKQARYEAYIREKRAGEL